MPRGLQGDYSLATRLRSMPRGCKEITLYTTLSARFRSSHVACKEIIRHLPRDYVLCHVVARRFRSTPRGLQRDFALCTWPARRLFTCHEITLYGCIATWLQGDFALHRGIVKKNYFFRSPLLYTTWSARRFRSMPRTTWSTRRFRYCHVACKEIIHHHE